MQLLEAAGMTTEELGEQGKAILALYEETIDLQQRNPKEKSIQETATATLKQVEAAMEKLIGLVKDQKEKGEEEQAKAEKKKEEREKRSLKVVETVEQEILPDLEACRARIREYNKEQKANAEPKPKKTRITKLKERLLSIASLIPEELKDDAKILEKTERILLDALHELKDVWGMSRIHPAEKAIKEKFEQLEEKAKT